MSETMKCPICKQGLDYEYVSVKLGKLHCKNCGWHRPLGEIKVASNKPDFGNALALLAGLTIAFLGAAAIASLLSSLSGENHAEERSERRQTALGYCP
jgi:hypothetical protein